VGSAGFDAIVGNEVFCGLIERNRWKFHVVSLIIYFSKLNLFGQKLFEPIMLVNDHSYYHSKCSIQLIYFTSQVFFP